MNEEEKKALEILETEGTENHYLEVQIVLYLVDKLQKEIIERDMLLDMYQNNYISKDKIREKIEELKEENRKLRKCHLRYEEMTGIDLLLEE